MLHLVCECQPLQTQHFFIFLFASFWMWLLIRFFANLHKCYSMQHHLSTLLLVMLSGCFGSRTQVRQNLSAESQWSDVLGARQLWELRSQFRRLSSEFKISHVDLLLCTSFCFKMDPYHRIPEKFEEFTQKYHSEIEKTSLSTHIVQIYSLMVAFLTWWVKILYFH